MVFITYIIQIRTLLREKKKKEFKKSKMNKDLL